MSTRLIWTVAIVVVLVAAGGASAWAFVGGPNAGYRTAIVGRGDVEETLDTSGTLQTVNSADLDFQVSGQVAGVDVSVGQQVSQGQGLATLDTSSLTSAVDAAQSSISAAEQKLTTDESSETAASSGTSSTSASSSTSTRSSSTGSATNGSSPNPSIGTDQAKLTSQQHQADIDSDQAEAALSQATTVCDGTAGSGSSTGSPTGARSTGTAGTVNGGTSNAGGVSPVGGGSGTGNGGNGGTGATGSPGQGSSSADNPAGTVGGSAPVSPSACTSALQQVLSDQQKVSQDQASVSQEEATLARALTGTSAATGTTGAKADSGFSGTDPAASTSSPSAGTSSQGTSPVAAPYEIAADQATLDADEAQLSEAQAALEEGQLVSPIAGTVASVNFSVGQTVAADSTSSDIEVIGPQSFDVSSSTNVSDLSEVKVGETADVVPDGQNSALVGTVTVVGPPPTSSSSTTYPVVISLPAGSQGLFDGASASVAIVVGRATDAVTVPTSAVHEVGRFTYVTELSGGTARNVPVSTGLVGDTLTQIDSGLTPGETVVLANLSEPLPSSSPTTGRSFAGVGSLIGGGGFGGAGFTPGQFRISRVGAAG